MNKHLRNSLLFLLPISLVIGLNEWTRFQQKDAGYLFHEIPTIHSQKTIAHQCSWTCHHQTNYCKKQHVKWAMPYFKQIDPLYFGMIGALASSGNYKMANIIFLVILWPLLTFFLLIKTLDLRRKIKALKPYE